MQDGASAPLGSTFQQTAGGRTAPYKAAAFGLTPCGDLPSLDAIGEVARAAEILHAYLVRVGDNGTCLSDPNFQGLCNPPLSPASGYRWVWAPGPAGPCAPAPPGWEDPKLLKCEAPCLKSLLCAKTLSGPIECAAVHRAPCSKGPHVA